MSVGLSSLMGCAVLRANERPAPDIHVDRSPEKVARGEYLTLHVMDCFGCHGTVDPAAGMVDRTRPAGGAVFGHNLGFPGTVYLRNLTADPETGLGSWTDGEILRAMREGVSRDGHPLFPIMPYTHYREMSDDDAMAIVAYLRTVPPVKNKLPDRQLDFPLNLIVNTIPQPLEGSVSGPANTPVPRGEYLFKMAACAECHTPMNQGRLDMSHYLAGGHLFRDQTMPPTDPGIRMPNITQDKETGIGAWTDQQIKDAVRLGREPNGRQLRMTMPWSQFNGLTEQDADDLVAFLRTIPPIKNKVDR